MESLDIDAWKIILQQGPLFAFMGLVIWDLKNERKKLDERRDKLEDERSAKDVERIEKLVTVVEKNTAAWERVEKRLDKH